MDNIYEKRLGTAPLLPLIIKMSLPAVAAQIINLLYSLIDRVYIGHIENIGTDALAGVGVTSSVIILISAFSQIVGGGGAPLAAIALGKSDRDKAEKIMCNGLVMLVFFTIITTTVTYIFMNPLLMITGASENTIKYAVDYLSVYLIGTLFVQITTGLNSFINAQGRPGIAMISVITGAVLNIVLDPLFIFTFKMGVKGAAIATVISQVCSALWIILFLCSKKASVRISLKYMKLDFKIIASVVSLGIAPFIMASTESLIGFVLNGNLSKYGDIYVSALTVMQSAMQIVSVPLVGFSQGFTPVISYNFGQKNVKRVKSAFKISLTIMFTFNFIMVILIILFASSVASMFTDDTVLIGLVSKSMKIFLTGMTIFGLQRACQNTFVALGQAKISLFIALLRKVILLIPLVFILSNYLGYKGVYLAESIADATAAIICISIFVYKFPKILSDLN